MVDHGETFWALFGVDLSAVLEQQSPDTWDTFPIFQMLNNYLRNHGHSPLGAATIATRVLFSPCGMPASGLKLFCILSFIFRTVCLENG